MLQSNACKIFKNNEVFLSEHTSRVSLVIFSSVLFALHFQHGSFLFWLKFRIQTFTSFRLVPPFFWMIFQHLFSAWYNSIQYSPPSRAIGYWQDIGCRTHVFTQTGNRAKAIELSFYEFAEWKIIKKRGLVGGFYKTFFFSKAEKALFVCTVLLGGTYKLCKCWHQKLGNHCTMRIST